MELELRYKEIQRILESISDFSEEELTKSRNLFNLETAQLVPKEFEVWTSLVGLPLPTNFTQIFQSIAKRITQALPSNTRFYKVIPKNYH